MAKATSQLESQSQKIKQLEKALQDMQQMQKERREASEAPRASSSSAHSSSSGKHGKSTTTVVQTQPYTYPPPPVFQPGSSSGSAGQTNKQQIPASFIGIVKGEGSEANHKENAPLHEQGRRQKRTESRNTETASETINDAIPAGSFASGILLSGLDAPTGGQASSSPHPVLIRLTDLTVLPNKFQTDLKSCFVIGEGYGDLSAERAYIKLNTLSCVKEDGSILEKQITGYVSGEDGKIGLKGRVVSKQGALLARALVAGFLQGAANIMQQQGTMVSISPLGTTQTINPQEVSRVALYSGAASAAEKLADFYMKLVKNEFPVIEINAGRKVDVVFLKKVKFD